ncbi:LPS-assembly protein LptD [Parasedimentitalea psychrophila]|uniref:LPS-assembly protein LptD n=1 Tax=Parasedimentitalea psychrophila TaxID=2997337 RepID=A0A9Y2P6F9_9RHOB|nr:LPS assembly protein LptD [Parasedimentitalea psychrophila]WIY24963.1 LPS assembly protein LptD [Parasedimentitalea psychrophila]
MRRTLYVLTLVPWMILASTAGAQQTSVSVDDRRPALLVADTVYITPDRTLIAEGNVEAYQGDIRLRAQKITFDRDKGTLHIEGPIRIDQGGEITILANAADMDKDLRNGILKGARMVFQQQLQLASVQMTRVSGRYTQLYKTSATSCQICDDGSPPLWQIRAEKVTHDQLERQLYFENAQFRILDVPVFYFPALRLPDPTLERASGLLVPSVRTTSGLGTGVKVPYFFTLGDSRDLTLAPYLSSKTRTLDARYRQAFKTGTLEVEGALTRDDLQPGDTRGYLFADGAFDLRKGYNLEFQIRTVSDDAYLADYGLPDLDRLRSQLTLTKVNRDSLFHTSMIYYKTLRDSDEQTEIPSSIGDIYYQQRFHPEQLGGELQMTLLAHAHNRSSNTDIIGRDIARTTVDANWQREWHLQNGVVTQTQFGLSADAFNIQDDSTYSSNESRLTPRGAITFRLPMTRQSTSGGTEFLEPIVQLGWTDTIGDAVPNDESNFVEFDQGNLLEMSRFPATDAREDGVTLVYGINWARYSQDGWQASAALGQVFRSTADSQFTKSSGLSGTSSDILMAGQLRLNDDIAITTRGLLNGALNFSKAELRGDWSNQNAQISGSYLWLGTDAAEGRTEETSEFWFNGRYQIHSNWSASANLRYDISDSRASRAGIGFVYTNECVKVDLSVNRRYTTTSSVEPSTDFGFTIALNGFSVDSGTQNYRRSCSNS